MMDIAPTFLLANPDLVTPQAPWCVTVDNLELGVLLLTQPWLTAGGVRRADLERQLTHLAVDLPIGPVYFQRVKRAVARLVDIGAILSIAHGRRVRFATTPEGFAALILNLRILRSDPTLDGREFELKRALVTMWHLVVERLNGLTVGSDPIATTPDTERFFHAVEALTVFGKPLVDEAAIEDAFDVLALIARQRQHVETLLAAARGELLGAEATHDTLRALDLASPRESGTGAGAGSAVGMRAAPQADAPETIAMIRAIAAKVLPRIGLQAKVSRYEQYLDYLGDLAHLLERELRAPANQSMHQTLRGAVRPSRGGVR